MKRHLVRYWFVLLPIFILSTAVAVQAQAPTISSLTHNPYDGGPNPVGIFGQHFGASQGTSTITFNGVVQSAAYGWSDTSLNFFPTGATNGYVVVTTSAGSSNAVYLQVADIAVTNLSPGSGSPGTTVTLTGVSFSSCQSGVIIINGQYELPSLNIINSTTATMVVPTGATGAGQAGVLCYGSPHTLAFTVASGPTASDPGLQASRFPQPISPPSSLGTDTNGANNNNFFFDGQERFLKVMTVSEGLGPRLNGNSCAMCHAQPALGGSSPCSTQSPCRSTGNNPQSTLIGSGLVSSTNTNPSFITSTGPVLEARFLYLMNTNGTVNTSAPSGFVEDIYTVNSPSCTLSQPNFAAAISANNIAYRLPTSIFGDGEIENIDDSTLLANLNGNLTNSFGISGTFNRNVEDGTINRFGWKAQIRSLHQFSGLAFNNEIGITNTLFPNERPNPEEEQLAGASGLPAGCVGLAGTLPNGLGYPEDHAQFISGGNGQGGPPALLDDVAESANWMRFLAPPPLGPVVLSGTTVTTASLNDGATQFRNVGCIVCHNQSPGTTQASAFSTALNNVTPQPYSDFEIHHMGSTLADNISQGNAGGDQFRTAPLWGLGNRYFLMHDGRTTDLLTAIADHAGNGSEASQSVSAFNALSAAQQQDLLNFLRSL